MSHDWDFKSGDWNLICDVCSKRIKASESKKRWDGLVVCSDDYEERQPLDFLRGRKERISVPFTRPRTQDTFVPVSWIDGYVDGGYILNQDDYVFEVSI